MPTTPLKTVIVSRFRIAVATTRQAGLARLLEAGNIRWLA
jgi:hypothetical protein